MRMATVLCSFLLLLQFHCLHGQQTYVNNKQLNCEQNDTTTLGYACNGAATSCASYLTFRSDPTYNSPATIGYLLGAEPSQIARINDISDVQTIPTDTLVIVPVNCSCSGSGSRQYYQHNASYVLKTTNETYFTVANNTYQGLTTCQSLMAQNPYNFLNLLVDMRLTVPLRCACPTSNQTAAGVNYLLTYLVTWGDSVDSITETFRVLDNRSVHDANDLPPDDLIFPFTPILVPLQNEPTMINTSVSSSPPPPPPSSAPIVPVGESNSSRKWVFVGVGIGAASLLLVVLSGFLVWSFRRRRRPSPQGKPSPGGPPRGNNLAESADYTALPERKLWSVSSQGVRYAIESLTVYKFEELQEATGLFGEANMIKGSVYRGCFKGDDAAVKMMKGDVSGEINILKQINHSNIIRLSGFCVHEGNTYLVYEYAEKGSLSDWLHLKLARYQTSSSTLGWKERVQIAYDVGDALNYLHNYTKPPYIHKNLKSSNILLDGNLRAKVTNFGLARTVEIQDEEGGLQLTRHVVGTYGYMAPEYIENGLITPKLDVFAFGVVMLELLSGREALVRSGGGHKDDEKEEGEEEELELLSATINQVLGGEYVREKLQGFMDPLLRQEYPLDLAYSMAQLARNCVAHDLNSRPTMTDVFRTLSKILSSSLDWDPSDQLEHSASLTRGR